MSVTNYYETLMVLESKLSEDQKNAIIEKIKGIIEAGGTLEKLDLWGNRRLAYPINYQTEGYYVVIQFTSNPELPREIERVYGITDGILRFLVIKRDERYLDVQVKLDTRSAAKASPKEEIVEETAEPSDEKPKEEAKKAPKKAKAVVTEALTEEVGIEEVAETAPEEVAGEVVTETVAEVAPIEEAEVLEIPTVEGVVEAEAIEVKKPVRKRATKAKKEEVAEAKEEGEKDAE